MSKGIRNGITYANVVSTLCLVFVVGGGTAWAVNEWTGANIVDNTIRSVDLRNNDVRSADLANDTTPYALTGVDIQNESMGSHDVIDNNLTGADVDESTLATVPRAAQGGVGRYATGGCNPVYVFEGSWVDCASLPVHVPIGSPGRVLITAQVQAKRSNLGESGNGSCRLEVNGDPIAASQTLIPLFDGRENATLTAVSGVIRPLPGPGAQVVGIECADLNDLDNFEVEMARISAVSLSAL